MGKRLCSVSEKRLKCVLGKYVGFIKVRKKRIITLLEIKYLACYKCELVPKRSVYWELGSRCDHLRR